MFTAQQLYRYLATLDRIKLLAIEGAPSDTETLDQIAALAQQLHRETLNALIALDRAQKRATNRNQKKKGGQSPAQTSTTKPPVKG